MKKKSIAIATPSSPEVLAKVQKILVDHDLDFIIEKQQSASVDANGNLIPNMKNPYFNLANLKTGEIINTCKKGYVISQNHEIVELIIRGMEGFGEVLSVTKAGHLDGGRKVFIQLEVASDDFVDGDRVTRYITIIDSNDGSTGLSIGIGDVTMSCSNQFVKFYKKGESKFRHTATMENKLKTIPILIAQALDESAAQIGLYQHMADTKITDYNIHELVKALLGYDRVITSVEVMATKKAQSIALMDDLYSCIYQELSGKGFNWWGLHSGVTRYTTHNKKHPKRANGNVESLMIGGAYKMNQKSIQFAKKKLGLVD